MIFVAVFVCVYMWIIPFLGLCQQDFGTTPESCWSPHTCSRYSRFPSEQGNPHKQRSQTDLQFCSFFFFLLHWSQICLRCITFPVVCAGLGQACLPAGESWEQERQQVRGRCTFFRGSLLGLQMFAAVREATWTYLIQHYYATETGLAARELAACARWNMWNAWVILPLHCPLPCATPPLQSLLMIRLFSR